MLACSDAQNDDDDNTLMFSRFNIYHVHPARLVSMPIFGNQHKIQMGVTGTTYYLPTYYFCMYLFVNQR